MNGTSGGPHILLFERDHQLTALLSGELALAGYEIHAARTAVEVFDAIARFPIKLVMVNLAQAQAGRREFWVALDAQRRGRDVQIFTFRCTNLGGYGPEDPDERVDTVLTDMEVDGMMGVVKLVEGVRTRVPVPGTTTPATPVRVAPATGIQEAPHNRALPTQASPVHVRASTMYMQGTVPNQDSNRASEVSSPMQASPIYQSASFKESNVQPLQGALRPQAEEMVVPPPPARPVEPPRPGRSTFTDKIRAVIYPSSRNATSTPDPHGAQHYSSFPVQNTSPYQHADAQPRLPAGQRFAEAEHSSMNIYQENIVSQSSANSMTASQPHPAYNASGVQRASEESGLDQLSRLLRESQPALQNAIANGNGEASASRPGLSINPQEIHHFHSQVLHAARLDEAYEHSSVSQVRPLESADMETQLRASPIQDVPFEQEIAYRRGAISGSLSIPSEDGARPAMAILQPTQTIPPVQRVSQSQPPMQSTPVQGAFTDTRGSSGTIAQGHPAKAPETPPLPITASQIKPFSHAQELSPQSTMRHQQHADSLEEDEEATVSEQSPTGVQSTVNRRLEMHTSDDMLLDIVKSLPPMAPASQPPVPQPQILNGRATRSLGSVLLEGHLVPQERLQVAQHVQRMLRGVDLNYQLGEILLMFKLLTPDQLLAASLVSYGMISRTQISGLGRIRQELHAMGLEYDLESLLILFRILTPEQLREVRASWSS